MRLPITLSVFASTWTLLVFHGVPISTADDSKSPKSLAVSDRVCAKLEALFQAYYPKATFDNRRLDGVHIEYEVTTFEFPYTGRKGAKHVAEKTRGPKTGGILCSVYATPGPYQGQLLLSPATEGKVAHQVIDRNVYKQLLMAPYSRKSDLHMWVALSFPPDADKAFLEKFRQVMIDFEKDEQ
jgi:hypothetical protein